MTRRRKTCHPSFPRPVGQALPTASTSGWALPILKAEPIGGCLEVGRIPARCELPQENGYRLPLQRCKQGSLAAVSHTELDRLRYHVSRLSVFQRREHECG